MKKILACRINNCARAVITGDAELPLATLVAPPAPEPTPGPPKVVQVVWLAGTSSVKATAVRNAFNKNVKVACVRNCGSGIEDQPVDTPDHPHTTAIGAHNRLNGLKHMLAHNGAVFRPAEKKNVVWLVAIESGIRQQITGTWEDFAVVLVYNTHTKKTVQATSAGMPLLNYERHAFADAFNPDDTFAEAMGLKNQKDPHQELARISRATLLTTAIRIAVETSTQHVNRMIAAGKSMRALGKS